jgi:adenylate cyclase
MCAPLVYKGKAIGVMALLRLAEHKLFDEGDLYFLDALARQAAVAITNARMFAQEEERATQLARALEKQQELDRFKSDFIRNVSHELRTPLGLILGNAEMLNTGYLGQLQPEQQKLMAVVARRARILTNMVEDFTIILSEQPPEVRFEHVNLAELVRNLVSDLQDAIEKDGLDLDLQIAPDLPLVWSDKTCLSRALHHLLDNARKFTPRGGRIVVNLEQVDEALVLRVSDTGIGISEDMFELIFELGFQVDASTSRTYEGTGLGLALVKKVVQDHRGTVSVASQLRQGSTFTVVLPISDALVPFDAFVF